MANSVARPSLLAFAVSLGVLGVSPSFAAEMHHSGMDHSAMGHGAMQMEKEKKHQQTFFHIAYILHILFSIDKKTWYIFVSFL